MMSVMGVVLWRFNREVAIDCLRTGISIQEPDPAPSYPRQKAERLMRHLEMHGWVVAPADNLPTIGQTWTDHATGQEVMVVPVEPKHETIEKVETHSFYLAQLRHAYRHLKSGPIAKPAEFADRLIAPIIRHFEASLASLRAKEGK